LYPAGRHLRRPLSAGYKPPPYRREARQPAAPHPGVPNAARAFEFHDDWSIALQATRFQLEEVKRTSIERAVVRAVVTRGDQVSVQALIRRPNIVKTATAIAFRPTEHHHVVSKLFTYLTSACLPGARLKHAFVSKDLLCLAPA